MKTVRSNKRKIQIDGKDFIVYGHNPWMLIATVPDSAIPAGFVITDAPFEIARHRPHMYNCLGRIAPNGQEMPVVFAGDKGYDMGSEICFILNQKL